MSEPGEAASVESATPPLGEMAAGSTEAPSPAELVRVVDLQAGAPADEQVMRALVAAERARLELEDVLESMSDAFYAYDHEWHLLRINRAGREIFRGSSVDPGDAVGKVIWDVMPAMRHGPMADALLRCARERAPVRVEALGPYTGRWLEVNVYPTAEGVAAYTHDISSRKKAEAAQRLLADAGALLSSALDPDETLAQVARLVVPELADWFVLHLLQENGELEAGVTVHADPGRCAAAEEYHRRYRPDPTAAAGPAAVARTGRSELHEIITDDMLRAAARDDEHLALLRALGMTSLLSVPLSARERRFGALTLVAAESGRRYDETDLRTAEELARRIAIALDNARLLQESRAAVERTARLQAVTAGLARAITPAQVADTVVGEGVRAFQASEGILCLTSEDGRWLEIVRSSGMPEQTVSEWRRFPLDADLPLSEAVRSGQPLFLENKATVQTRYPAVREANERAATESWLALPLTSDGDPIGGLAFGFAEERSFTETDRAFAIALAQQCTLALERTRLYEAERAARARADEANRAKSEFLAVMSHELRTPLNAIAGYAELLELGIHGQLTPPQTDAIDRIRRSQRHLLGLINDVLSFARIDAGHIALEIEDVSLHQIALSLEPLVEPQFRRKGLHYGYDECDPSLAVRADAEKLRQILLNLLSNAIKFTDVGGRVTVSCTVAGDRAAIAVRDSGRGIPPDKLDRIFEPFVQLEAGRTRTHDGTGLGLAISRDLARVMHGEITVESEVGVGSTFTLMLPRGEA